MIVPRLVRPYSLIWMVGSAAWVAFLISTAMHPAPVDLQRQGAMEAGLHQHPLVGWLMLGGVTTVPLVLLWIGLLVAQDIVSKARKRT